MYEDFFAERLSALRIAKNISAREMSLAIGQNESYINRIENRKAFPSMQVFFYICEYLNISPGDFFNAKPESADGITADIKRLTARQTEIISLLIKELINK